MKHTTVLCLIVSHLYFFAPVSSITQAKRSAPSLFQGFKHLNRAAPSISRPDSDKKVKCANIKCPTKEEPVCVKLKTAVKNIYVIVINKCEMVYMKCHEGLEAIIVPMKNCLHKHTMDNSNVGVKKRVKRSPDIASRLPRNNNPTPKGGEKNGNTNPLKIDYSSLYFGPKSRKHAEEEPNDDKENETQLLSENDVENSNASVEKTEDSNIGNVQEGEMPEKISLVVGPNMIDDGIDKIFIDPALGGNDNQTEVKDNSQIDSGDVENRTFDDTQQTIQEKSNKHEEISNDESIVNNDEDNIEYDDTKNVEEGNEEDIEEGNEKNIEEGNEEDIEEGNEEDIQVDEEENEEDIGVVINNNDQSKEEDLEEENNEEEDDTVSSFTNSTENFESDDSKNVEEGNEEDMQVNGEGNVEDLGVVIKDQSEEEDQEEENNDEDDKSVFSFTNNTEDFGPDQAPSKPLITINSKETRIDIFKGAANYDDSAGDKTETSLKETVGEIEHSESEGYSDKQYDDEEKLENFDSEDKDHTNGSEPFPDEDAPQEVHPNIAQQSSIENDDVTSKPKDYEDVDIDEYKSDCPTVCPVRDVMLCARCKEGVYRTFLSACHLRMFNCRHPDEKLELVSRKPCMLSAPFLSDMPKAKGRVGEIGDEDLVLNYLRCKEQSNKDDPRCQKRI